MAGGVRLPDAWRADFSGEVSRHLRRPTARRSAEPGGLEVTPRSGECRRATNTSHVTDHTASPDASRISASTIDATGLLQDSWRFQIPACRGLYLVAPRSPANARAARGLH